MAAELSARVRLVTVACEAACIKAVLRAHQLCAAHGCELQLIQGQPQIQRIFGVSGLIDYPPFRDDDVGDFATAVVMLVSFCGLFIGAWLPVAAMLVARWVWRTVSSYAHGRT